MGPNMAILGMAAKEEEGVERVERIVGSDARMTSRMTMRAGDPRVSTSRPVVHANC